MDSVVHCRSQGGGEGGREGRGQSLQFFVNQVLLTIHVPGVNKIVLSKIEYIVVVKSGTKFL